MCHSQRRVAYTDAYGYCYSYTDCNTNSNCNCNCYSHTNANTNSYTKGDACGEASAINTAAETIVGNITN